MKSDFHIARCINLTFLEHSSASAHERQSCSGLGGARASLAHAAPDTTAALATAVVWCGAVTCAYTIWAQSFGQRGVPAARANLVYTSQPVFSALFAFGLLHEVPTAATLAGGGLILIAVAAEVLAMDEAPA